MKKIAYFFYLLLIPTMAYSHTGDIDQYGCHHDTKKNTYHCHYGVLAGKEFTSQSHMQRALQRNPQESGTYYQGKVISIIDGDTFKIALNNKSVVVRLADIDAPEINQAFGMKAKQFTGNLIFNKIVRVKVVDSDQHDQLSGHVYLGAIHVNAEIVEQGFAWADMKHLKDRNIIRLEALARNQKRGLWASGSAIPPWEWRTGKR